MRFKLLVSWVVVSDTEDPQSRGWKEDDPNGAWLCLRIGAGG